MRRERHEAERSVNDSLCTSKKLPFVGHSTHILRKEESMEQQEVLVTLCTSKGCTLWFILTTSHRQKYLKIDTSNVKGYKNHIRDLKAIKTSCAKERNPHKMVIHGEGFQRK